ncbi:MAG: hypothetical protein AAGE84_15055 [Cyanobacteria bacterium P01_G01_bin.39]
MFSLFILSYICFDEVNASPVLLGRGTVDEVTAGTVVLEAMAHGGNPQDEADDLKGGNKFRPHVLVFAALGACIRVTEDRLASLLRRCNGDQLYLSVTFSQLDLFQIIENIYNQTVSCY